MAVFSEAERSACQQLIDLAFVEDLGPGGAMNADLTTRWFVADRHRQGATALVARHPGVLAGVGAAEQVFSRMDSRLRFETRITDGTSLSASAVIATVVGSMHSILAAERTALNFVQYLSGIATQTRQYVDAVAGLPVRILDTRKTLPGWRLLAKYAVRRGGGDNHRMGLHDMILVKDNHWGAMPEQRSLAQRVAAFRGSGVPGLEKVRIEIEVDTLAQLAETLAAHPDIVLLDNMPLAVLREAVALRNKAAPKVLLEASGGVNLRTVRGIAETGVDRISVGALTHSVTALDIGLDYES